MPGADFRGTAGEEGNGIVTADGFAVGSANLLTELYSGSATIDPASIDAAATATATITVTGAAVGDFALVAPGVDLQGLVYSAYVSAADTVEIAIYNPTAGAIDLASSTWKALVFSNG